MITVIVAPDEFDSGRAVVRGASYRHLFRARRVAVGRQLRVVDGRGRSRWGEVAAVDRLEARLDLGEEAPTHEATVRVELIVAAPRSQRAGWLVEKATEIGVTAIRFVACGRAPREYGEAALDRLRRVAFAAVEQCHRSKVPEVTGIHPWSEASELIAGCKSRWLLDPGGPTGALEIGSHGCAMVIVGPEGGWETAEEDLWIRLRCRKVSLGARILRVETAAVAASALLLTGAAGR